MGKVLDYGTFVFEPEPSYDRATDNVVSVVIKTIGYVKQVQ